MEPDEKNVCVTTSQAAHRAVCPDAGVFCTHLKDWWIVDMKGSPYQKAKETHVQPRSTFKRFREDLDWIVEKKWAFPSRLCVSSAAHPHLRPSIHPPCWQGLWVWYNELRNSRFSPRNRVFVLLCLQGKWKPCVKCEHYHPFISSKGRSFCLREHVSWESSYCA